jgi:hypothetical protein
VGELLITPRSCERGCFLLMPTYKQRKLCQAISSAKIGKVKDIQRTSIYPDIPSFSMLRAEYCVWTRLLLLYYFIFRFMEDVPCRSCIKRFQNYVIHYLRSHAHTTWHDTERQTNESPTALRNSHRSDSDHNDRIP